MRGRPKCRLGPCDPAYAPVPLRILLVTPFLPDPHASHGGGAFLGSFAEALGQQADLRIAALLSPAELAGAQALSAGKGTVLGALRKTRRGGMAGLPQRLSMLVRWGVCGLPLVAAKHESAAMRAALRRVVREFRPDAALVELAQMAQYLPDLAGVPTVFTDHEAGVPANTRTDLGAWADHRDQRLWCRYVDRYYRQATALQALTTEDAATLSQLLGREVLVRPPTLHMPAQPSSRLGTKPRLLFLGSYRHEPNQQAARRIARAIWPRIRALVPDAELWLAGADSERIADLAKEPGVSVRGFVPDLEDLFRSARAALAPVYSGGGLRIKSLAALAHGVPVVTNALGARGAAAPDSARICAESDEDLATAAAALLRDEQRADAMGKAAFAWAAGSVAPAAVAKQQLDVCRALLRG